MALLGLVSCESEMESFFGDANPIALRGIRADIDNGGGKTRAVAPLIDSIGKYDFLGTDKIVFTLIERTKRPIRPNFSYANVQYSCLTADGNVSWKRESPQTDIFWSDGSEPHTFIGYILPHADDKSAAESGFDWHRDARGVYYGSIGDPTLTGDDDIIDYTGDPELGEDQKDPYSTEQLRKEDLLLTYSTEMQNEDAMAWVHFHHGLASIRVTVTITGYSTTGEDPDSKTMVTDMVVKDQPTMYKWDNHGFRAAPLVEADQTTLNSLWGGSAPAWNQKKDMKLWQSRQYHGVGASRTFIFYGITSPGMQDQVDMTFKVTYPDPLDPNHENPARLEKTYTATLQLPDSRKVEFRPGYCTSININLNHKDEKMTVGAEYMSWQYDDSPNEGSLRKNSTYLAYTDRNKITIVGDEHATADDATWLYQGTSGKIYDIYGNDGSAEHPFLISTADQLLSFAYEVKGTSRTSTTCKDLAGNDLPLSGAFDFKNYHIKLDADITMQANMSSEGVTWQGIGDATHKFNGYFNGGFRHIRKLKGAPFFNTVGEYGIVDHIFITDALGITGSGSIAEKNLGIICGSHVEGDIVDETYTEYCGSIVGVNSGVLIACSHIGDITGNSNILGALLGKNDGIMVTCYNVGDAKNNATGKPAYAGVGDFTPRSVAYCCYFNKDFYTSQDYANLRNDGTIGHVAFPLSTSEMQSNKYVNQASPNEITDASDKDDMFYWHWSLNTGLNRAIAYLSQALEAQSGDNIQFHAPGTSDTALDVSRVTLKRTQVQWLISHYANQSHAFLFIPGSYPKLQ